MRKTEHIAWVSLFRDSLIRAFILFNPQFQIRNPVIFVTYLSALGTSVYVLQVAMNANVRALDVSICLWLWLTILIANFAQAIAENRAIALAASLKQTQPELFAKRVVNGTIIKVSAAELRTSDVIVCEPGDMIPADGDVIEGVATVDESAITGESAPVIRESGGDHSAVTAGTKVISDRLLIKIVAQPGQSFLDRMITLTETKRRKTPNEIALQVLLGGLAFVFLVMVVSTKFLLDYSAAATKQDFSTMPVLASLLVCLLPTTIAALSNPASIAGMYRLVRHNVITDSGRSVEIASDIDLHILDKTGTITLGTRMATAFLPVVGMSEAEFAQTAQLASMYDETPEGRSIVNLAQSQLRFQPSSVDPATSISVPFSAKTRMSGIDFTSEEGRVVRSIRKGAVDAIREHVEKQGGTYPAELDPIVRGISIKGATPLLVSDNAKIIGTIQLKDVVKEGIKQRFEEMRHMGIRTLLITGDNPLTAAAITAESGIDDYIAEATPEMKLAVIRREQQAGRLVAMSGDGTNDAPALAQADIGVAMSSGTQASREASNMVDLDSDPTKLIEVVSIGKQLLLTRGALTTISITTGVGKSFAILPALFGGVYAADQAHAGPLSTLNIMGLYSPNSAILSALIFNALATLALMPLALIGVAYRGQSTQNLLRRNMMIYGLGGLLAPFIGIKLIDTVLYSLGVG